VSVRSVILVNNQLDAQFFFIICLFQFSTCFEQPCAHHQENQLYHYDIWHMSLYVGYRLVCKFGWCSIYCTETHVQQNMKLHSMIFAQRRNRLTTHFSEVSQLLRDAWL